MKQELSHIFENTNNNSLSKIEKDYINFESYFTNDFGEKITRLTVFKNTRHMPKITTFVVGSGSSNKEHYPFRIFKIFSIPNICNIVFYISSGAADKEKYGVPSKKWYPIFGITQEKDEDIGNWLVKGQCEDMIKLSPKGNPIPYGNPILGIIKRYLDTYYSDDYLSSIKRGYVLAMANLKSQINELKRKKSIDISQIDLSKLLLQLNYKQLNKKDYCFFCPNISYDGQYGYSQFIEYDSNGEKGIISLIPKLSKMLQNAIYATIENRCKLNLKTIPTFHHDNGRIKELNHIIYQYHTQRYNSNNINEQLYYDLINAISQSIKHSLNI